MAEEAEDPATHTRLLARLREAGVAHSLLAHAPTKTSEDSAAVRGVSLASGAKALVCTAVTGDRRHALVVMSATHGLDWGKLRAVLGAKYQMAKLPDVFALTGCIPGAVPPLGSLFPGIHAFVVDQSLVEQGPHINFNAGLRTASVVGLSVEDYLRLEAPRVEDVCVPLPAKNSGAAGAAPLPPA